MTASQDAAATIRDKLATFIDPYLGQTLAQANAIESVSVHRNGARIELKFGFPCADYGAELAAGPAEPSWSPSWPGPRSSSN